MTEPFKEPTMTIANGVEAALHESEQRFQFLYNNNPTMYFTLSPDGTVLSVNTYGSEQLGYRAEELIGGSVLAVFKPEDHDTVLGQLTVCTTSLGRLFEWEIQKIRKDGTALWVKERAQAVRDQSGRVLVLVVCEDVTLRRLTEEMVRESEERWRALFERAGVGMAQLSVSGQFLRVNPRLCETLGYSSKTMLQHTFQDLTHPDDLAADLRYLKELAAGTRPSFSMEKRCRRSDDSWVWVNLTVSLVRTTSCAPAYYIAVVEDISERKRSEHALREQEALLRSVIDTATDAIFMKDHDGRYRFINQAGASVIGTLPEQIVGKSDREIFPVETAERLMADDRQVLTGAQQRRFERVIPHGQQARIFYSIKTPHRDHAGNIVGLVGVSRDMTETKHAEEVLRLTQIAVDRAADLAFWISPDAKFLYVNDAACERLGYSRRELLSMTMADIDPDYQRDNWPGHWQELRRKGRLRFETGHRTRSGHIYPVEVVANYVECEGLEYNFSFCRDITDQKRAENALRESEERLQRFVSEAPVGLVILDNQRRVLTANNAFSELTGYDEQELIGRSYDLYAHPEDLPGNVAVTDQFYRGVRTKSTIEKCYRRKSGDTIWVSVRAAGIELPTHPGPLLLAAVQDITDQKRATEERERLSQDLHDNILQSLYAVGMQLEASTLAAGTSARKSKGHAKQAIDQLNQLVRDVRRFIALLKRGTSPQLDFGGALHRLVSAFSAADHRPPELEIEEGVLSVIDPLQAEQLLNIAREALSNSVRHAQAVRRSIRLSRPGGGVRMQICDDGIGFIPKLKRKHGHGLLNMAARAKKIGARLRLTSKPNQGTCVTVDLSAKECL